MSNAALESRVGFEVTPLAVDVVMTEDYNAGSAEKRMLK